MSQAPRLKRLLGRSLPLAAALALLVSTAAASAGAIGPKHHGPLSSDLRRLAEPAVRGRSQEGQAAALGLPPGGPGSLVRDGRRVLVDVRFDAGAAARIDALRAAGAEIAAVSPLYQTVTAAVAPAALHEVAAVSGVGSVTAVPAPIVFAGEECEGGSVISEGVAQLRAKAARETFALDGEGVTVGVLSDSYDKATKAVSGGPVETHAKEDVESADLPGPANPCLDQKPPVAVRREFSSKKGSEEAFDEGRAMLQIVHDMAPAAKLAFASAYFGEVAFAESIEDLARPLLFGGAGAKVVVDDIGYLEEPFFQDGPIAAAVNKVTAEGVTYLSAAGNDNLVDAAGRDIASWEAPGFRDAGSCPGPVAALGSEWNGTHCMDFAPGPVAVDTTFGITVDANRTLLLSLQWAEPWFGVGTDLDAFLLNGSGSQVLAAETADNVSATKKPVELLTWKNESTSPRTVQLAINRFSGGNPRLKFVLLENGSGVSAVEYPSSSGGDVVGPTVFGHAGAAGAIAAGAVRFSDSTKPERYSSRGPVTHYFGEVSGTSPAPPLGAAQVIPKPDLVATDCGATTFFASKEGTAWRFCGTSAAAPHAAGAAALMMQAASAAGGGRDQPGAIRAALLRSASPVGTFGACAVGAGLVETVGAVGRLLAGVESPPGLNCSPPASTPVSEPLPSTAAPVVPTPTPPRSPVAPATTILEHPPKLVRTRGDRARVVFRFGSDQGGVRFLCRIDRAPFRGCRSRIVRRLRLGSHVVRARAVSSAGLADPTPAVFRFRVQRVP